MIIKSSNDSKLDQEIASALEELETLRDEPDKYAAVLDRIAKLQKLKSETGLKPPSMDTILVIGANIFGILWLTRYESDRVIPSKAALGLVLRPKP